MKEKENDDKWIVGLRNENNYFLLLKRYKKAIDDMYNSDNSSSSDYTPDHMSSDFDGFKWDYNNDEYDYYKELKQAVNKAELYVKYLDHEYQGTFG